ncbi:unnamed protein product [Chondrus crispus]|uniref:Uncharacterized protein n=1 Tax=Chondrus crispus TaxID=2769 RepID=R7QMJ4_CHOCR|nr:unnamed protein product [Chondrus crispus]CDF38600.1 unnamed protein product [Chondrus crispus]|eukprot:XP_005718505.1 unnamed protein product [Chondrus crispus]
MRHSGVIRPFSSFVIPNAQLEAILVDTGTYLGCNRASLT